MCSLPLSFYFFFFNDTATTEIYTLSLHDALPIWQVAPQLVGGEGQDRRDPAGERFGDVVHRALCRTATVRIGRQDRKSTRLNSSHSQISYAVFCLKKKKRKIKQ